MASRIAQLPDIALISGVTRPLGEVPPEFRATFQAGIVGARLAEGSEQIGQRTGDLNELATGANTLADSLGDVRAQVNSIAPSLQTLLDALSSVRTEYGGDKLVRDVETAAKLVKSLNELGNSMGLNFTAVRDMFGWIGPVLAALNGNAVCDANPSCRDTRIQFQRLMEARDDGRLDRINTLAGQLQGFEDRETLNSTVKKLNGALNDIVKAVNGLGVGSPAGAQAGLSEIRRGADRLATGSRQVAGGVDELVAQIKVMAAGLDQASTFLLTMRHDAAASSMAGFNIPAEVLNAVEFQQAAKAFIAPDGHSARYLVQTELNPFSPAAMDQVNTISDVARGAQPNTTLADASISMGGFPAALRTPAITTSATSDSSSSSRSSSCC